jgi:hypothetical protein
MRKGARPSQSPHRGCESITLVRILLKQWSGVLGGEGGRVGEGVELTNSLENSPGSDWPYPPSQASGRR